MKKVLLQHWEESERGWGVRPDGASLHLNEISHKIYVDSIYKNRSGDAPHEYDRTVGNPITIEVSDGLYELLSENGNYRLTQYQLNNLLKVEDLIIKTYA